MANFWAQTKRLFLPTIYQGASLLSGAAKATGTLTSDATAPANDATVTIDGVVYTYKTTLSTGPTVPFEVLIGASAAAALDNLKSAINASAGEGTTYSTGTTAHPTVSATTNTDTTQVVQALTAGTPGNAITTTETSSHLAWGGATLTGGTGNTDVLQYGGLAFITAGFIDKPTLATPVAGLDDGKRITVISTTAFAHVVNTANNKIAGGGGTAFGNTLTFAAKEGAGFTLVAYQGIWYVMSLVNVTLSEV